MLKKAILTGVLSTVLFAGNLNINDKFSSFSLPDQFDKIHNVNSNLSTIIVSFEKETSKLINEYLSHKNVNFLKIHKSVFIADISSMPSIITKLFALPKMRDYKHPILLIYDEKGNKFLKKDDNVTIYNLKNGVVSNINFVSSKNELEKIFNHE